MSIDLSTMTTKIFADGADLDGLLRLAAAAAHQAASRPTPR